MDKELDKIKRDADVAAQEVKKTEAEAERLRNKAKNQESAEQTPGIPGVTP